MTKRIKKFRSACGYKDNASVQIACRFSPEEFKFLMVKSDDRGYSLAEAIRICVRYTMKVVDGK